jgi:hypothetical protein
MGKILLAVLLAFIKNRINFTILLFLLTGTVSCYRNFDRFGGDTGHDGGFDHGVETDAAADSGIVDQENDTGIYADTGGCFAKADFTPCDYAPEPAGKYQICAGQTCISPGCGTASCNSPGPSFPAPPERGWHFMVDRSHQDQPMVKDEATGLVWMGCIVGRTGTDCSGNPSKFKWSDAVGFCNSADWGGHMEWRLPDIWESLSIVDFGLAGPAIDGVAFPATSCTDYYWTSLTIPESDGSAWVLDYYNGGLNVENKGASKFIRCVRGGNVPHPLEPGRYIRSGATEEPITRDLTTGLSWQGCVYGRNGTGCHGGDAVVAKFDAAVSDCTSLSWGGESGGWRLPKIEELAGILDFRKPPPFADSSYFPNTIGSYEWSATNSADIKDGYWCIDLSTGVSNVCSKDLTATFRCVRGP